MRLLARNKQTIYYRNYAGIAPITNTEGLETGEYEKTYGEVKTVKAYVKSAIGENAAEPFGDFTSKRRTIYLEYGKADDITEQTLLWVGIDPEVVTDEPVHDTDPPVGEPTIPHNFTIDGIARGINHIRIAIRQVDVSG